MDSPRRLRWNGPRQFTPAGRIVVPADGGDSGFDNLCLLADVLRKQVDLSVGDSYFLAPVDGDLHGNLLALQLDTPIDLDWLAQKAELADVFQVRRENGSVQIWNGPGFLYSNHSGDDPAWLDVGWRAGRPWSGQRPARHWRRRSS